MFNMHPRKIKNIVKKKHKKKIKLCFIFKTVA
jgi:hypothetical protein